MYIIDNPLNHSIKKDILPEFKNSFSKEGYFIVRPDFLNSDDFIDNEIGRYITAISSIFANVFSESFSFYELLGEGDDNDLPVHTEGIYLKEGVFPAFVLGCLRPSETGGTTRLFDARKIAKIIKSDFPSLCDIEIEYKSNSYQDEKNKYKLVDTNIKGDFVFRYREGVEDVFWHNIPEKYEIDQIRDLLKRILLENILVEHIWKRGDILFVNNDITLHDRTAYTGLRKMIRIRFNDNKNCKVTL